MNTFSIWNFEKYKDLDAFVEILKKNKNRVKKYLMKIGTMEIYW